MPNPPADAVDAVRPVDGDARPPRHARPPRPSDRPPLAQDRPGRFDRPRPGGFDRPRPGGFDRPRQDAFARRPSTAAGDVVELAEGEELVAGRRPVEEAFVARREARRLLVVPQRRLALEKLVLHATSLRIPVVEVEGGSLTAIAGFDGHQGVALVVAPRQWAGLDDILALATQRHEPALILVLDSLEDPQNVGTLLRSAEASGVHGAIFPTHRQAPLTPAAVKASAGAVEHLRLAPLDDLPGALADLHARGLRIVGADGDAPLSAREADLRGPIAIVVGSEGRGLGPAVRRRCDLLVRIPMHGRIDSLNAAVAGSILLYEAAAQRGLPGNQPAAAPDGETASATQDSADAPPVPPDGEPVLPPPGRTRKPAASRARRATAPTAPTAPVSPPPDELLPGGPAVGPGIEAQEPPSPPVADDPGGGPPEAAAGPSEV